MSTLTMTIPNGLPSGAKTGAATRNVGTCGVCDDAMLLVQLDRRNVDLVRGQLDGFLEVRIVALALQFRVGHDSNRTVRARAVDTEEFASPVFDPDEAELRISRLGAEIGDDAREQTLAPDLFGEVVDRIDPAVETGEHHSVHRRMIRECRDIGTRAGHVRLQVRGEQPRMRLDAVEHARQQRLFQVAIAQPSDRGDRGRNQQDHRDG